MEFHIHAVSTRIDIHRTALDSRVAFWTSSMSQQALRVLRAETRLTVYRALHIRTRQSKLCQGITRWDKVYQSHGILQCEPQLCAQRGWTAPKNSTENITKSQKSMVFTHMQNHATAYTFHNAFSGQRGAQPKLHCTFNSRHGKVQPVRIGATRAMAKTLTETYKYIRPTWSTVRRCCHKSRAEK